MKALKIEYKKKTLKRKDTKNKRHKREQIENQQTIDIQKGRPKTLKKQTTYDIMSIHGHKRQNYETYTQQYPNKTPRNQCQPPHGVESWMNSPKS